MVGCSTGTVLNSTASISVKIAVLAPIPSASESTATIVKPGVLASVRTLVPQIPHEVFEPGKSALIALSLDGLRQAAGVQPCRAPCGVRRCPAPPSVLRGEFEVRPKLLFEPGVRPPRAERRPQPHEPFTECDHFI